MSIIITGLEMPTERESFNLTIKYNGTVLDTETGMQGAEAHELPPHGRLIDASETVRVQMYDEEHEDWYTEEMTIDDMLGQGWIDAEAPTIIPASEEVE